jgi:hypothetical protein
MPTPGPKIIAPTLSSIFQAAADQLSKRNKMELQQQQQESFPNVAAGAPQPRLEVITGAVTQMQDMFGMVGGEVFFQTR